MGVQPERAGGARPPMADAVDTAAGGQRRQALAGVTVVSLLLCLSVAGVLWLDRSDLADADCSAVPAPGVDWRRCRLLALAADHADLRGVRLSHGAAPGAQLQGADMALADLRHTDLRGADLSDVRLGGADLTEADLRGADLRHARLRDADLSAADLRGARLGGADLRGARLDGALWLDGRRCAADATGRCDAPQQPEVVDDRIIGQARLVDEPLADSDTGKPTL